MSYLANHRAFYSSSMAMKEGYKIFLSTLQPILRHKIPIVIGWSRSLFVILTLPATVLVGIPAICGAVI